MPGENNVVGNMDTGDGQQQADGQQQQADGQQQQNGDGQQQQQADGQQQQQDPKWYDSLPDDLKGNEKLTRFSSVEDMAKEVANAPDAHVVPAADGYTLPENLPFQDFGTFANETGLSQAQVDKVLAYQATKTTEAQGAEQTFIRGELKKVLDGWGEEAKPNVALANQALVYHDSEDKAMTNFLRVTGAGNHPVVVKFLHKIGLRGKEDGYLTAKNLDTREPSSKQSYADVMYPNQGKENQK